MNRPLLVLALLTTAFPTLAQQPQTKTLGTYQAWTAYLATVGNAKICYVYAVPEKSEGRYTSRDPTYVQVSHRPGDKVTDEVSMTAGYSFKEHSTVEIEIGAQKFELFTNGDGAWARDRKTDAQIVKAMVAGAGMVVRGTSIRGTATTDTYSLNGFTAAHGEIDKACSGKG